MSISTRTVELARLTALARNSPGPSREILRDWLLADSVYGVKPEAVEQYMPQLLRPDFRKAMRLWEDPEPPLPTRTPRRNRHYDRLCLWNGWCVSVQCADGHYCRPRKGGLPLEQYEAFEIAVWSPGAPYYQKLHDYPLFQHGAAGAKHPIVEHWGNDVIGPFIPYQIIQQLIDFLEEQT